MIDGYHADDAAERTTADIAREYHEAGWHPLELPARKKANPPVGRCGHDGVDMTVEEIAAASWAGNIGLRMADDVIGVDVDVYHGGDATLAELLARCGPLPPTKVSHSGRNDGSGIMFFRVPAAMSWIAGLAGIEIIQRAYRHAMVWPSIHPEGRPYAWADQAEDAPVEGVPRVEDLPELPWPWVGELSRANASDAKRGVRSKVATLDEVSEFIKLHTKADAPSYIGQITAHFTERRERGCSRHDTMQHCLIWALEHVRAGIAPAESTLKRFADLWVEAVADDPRRAELHSERRVTEFDAMVRHAIGKANAKTQAEVHKLHDDVAGIPVNAPVRPASVTDDQRGGTATAAPAVADEVRFRRYSVSELRAEDRTFLWDVVGMLSRRTYGLDGGELKTLKSYFGLARLIGLAAGVPVLGRWKVPERRRVLAFVAEGGRKTFTSRLERMAEGHGIDPGDLDGWLEVIDDVAPLDGKLFRERLAFHLRDFAPGFVHLDPLYPFQPVDVDSNRIAEVGRMLTDVHRLCAEHEATFWVTAHMNQTGNGFDLKRISGAGAGEWADSWALLRHRCPPDVNAGQFRLGLALGSRQWSGSTWDLDLNLGRFDADLGMHDGPIRWKIQPAAAGAGQGATAGADELATAKVDILRVGRQAQKPLAKTAWAQRAGRRGTTARAAFDELVADGEIVQVGDKKPPTYEVVRVP